MIRSKLVILAGIVTLCCSGGALASEDLAKANNCTACHMTDGKLVGPSFKEIAQQYKDDESAKALLADKIKNGGAGTWGDIPMPPNPAVDDADIEALVDWMLSL